MYTDTSEVGHGEMCSCLTYSAQVLGVNFTTDMIRPSELTEFWISTEVELFGLVK